MSAVAARVTLERGRLEIAWPPLAASGPIVARVLLTDGTELLGGAWRRSDGVFRATCGPLRLALRLKARGARVRIELSAQAVRAAEVAEVGFAAAPTIGGERSRWVVASGYQSWDASGVLAATGAKQQSWWTCGLADDAGRGIAVSAVAARRTTTRFDLTGDRLVVTGSEPTGLIRRPLLWSARPGGRGWSADPILVSAGDDVRFQLRSLAGAVRGRAPGKPPQGWLSWYHYGPWITREDFLANARELDRGRLAGLGYRYVQLDDGWQDAYGEWRPNSKFPGGIEAVAAQLAKDGQVMGIWTAPFLVAESSDLARSAPDAWFVKDPITGERATDPVHVVFGPMQILDARRKAVRDHLAAVFSGLRNAGVRYFKIDFLYAGGYAGTRAVRLGVEAIRKAIGDSYLLACGAPLLPVVGLADGCRIGRDTATPLFDFEAGAPKPTLLGEEITEVGSNQAWRHFLDRWFELDSDVALVGGNLTLDQARTCVTICALSGGPFFASDDLVNLEPERLGLLTNRDVLRLVGGRPAVPDWDPDPSGRPSRVWRRDRIVAVFNWSDGHREERVAVAPAAKAARDLWTAEPVEIANGALTLDVPAQGVRLVELDRG